jgi:hypothetical protein
VINKFPPGRPPGLPGRGAGYPPTPPPGGPYNKLGEVVGDESHPVYALRARPTIALSLNNVAAAKSLLSRECILVGWHIRESAGGSLPANPQTDVDASSATAAAANNVTLPGVAGATTYITDFEITGNGATAAGPITITVTGILGGTKTYVLEIPTIASTAQVTLLVVFPRPIPASALNTAIVVNVPSFGAGNTAAAVTAHGFQQIGGSGGGPNSVADIYDGNDATGALVASLSIPPFGQSDADGDENSVYCRAGLFFNLIQGQFTGALWVKI